MGSLYDTDLVLFARTLAAQALRQYAEQPRQELAGLSYDEAQVLGPWLPDEAP